MNGIIEACLLCWKYLHSYRARVTEGLGDGGDGHVVIGGVYGVLTQWHFCCVEVLTGVE